jgi:5-methylcytosine-specific restriction endonuclease McrA
MGNNPEMPSRVSKLLKKQKGKCTHCGLFFREDDVMEVDHRIPNRKVERILMIIGNSFTDIATIQRQL